MSYRVRFHRSARAEFDQCCHTYPCMEVPLRAWLVALADEAERHEECLSFDIEDLPPYLAKAFAPKESSWQETWGRFPNAKWVEEFKAILEIVKTRKPPWQLRASWNVFPVLHGAFHCLCIVFFDVDHVRRQIVIRLFDGLPGQ